MIRSLMGLAMCDARWIHLGEKRMGRCAYIDYGRWKFGSLAVWGARVTMTRYPGMVKDGLAWYYTALVSTGS